jgi:hypothetical protein
MAIDSRVQQRVVFEFEQGHDLVAFERQRAVERRSNLRVAADSRVQVTDRMT